MTYEQVVEYCRQYADIIRDDGIDLFLSDIGESAVISDMLGHPLEMQNWINRESWKRVLDLIDKL